MRKVYWIKPVFIALVVLFLVTECKKDKTATLPELANISMTIVADTYAESKYKVRSDGGATVTECGVCWSTAAEPDTTNSKTSEGGGLGTFTTRITGLTPGTTYHVRAYAINSAGVAYSDDITFLTKANLPTVTTSPISAIAVSSATCGGNIISDGGGTITARGVCWSTSINPTTSNLKTMDGNGSGEFTSNITGLTEGTVYHVRAYASNALGTAYGSDISFSTNAILPVLTTSPVSAITTTTASGGGNISSNGGATITARGVCWSITSNPTTTDSKTTDGVGSGQFISNITGLSPGSAYHLRAYATNSVGTAYGADMQFTTLGQVPVCVAQQATNLTISGATLNGIVNANYLSSAVTFEYGLTTAYGQTITATQSLVTGNSLTNVSADITGLTQGTTYHFRVKAVNSLGTVYSGDISFVTPNYSILNTIAVSAITYNSATSGGNIISDGGSAITARGVCWNTTGNPTVSDPNTTNGTGTGSFASSLAGLLPNTLYYVRAYATNSVGTSYGNQLSFTTLSGLPVSGLVAYYPFNGNAKDESINANDGIVVGASLTTDRNGNTNSAYYFDGVNSYIEITGALPVTNTFTMSFWAFCENATGYNNILCDGSSSAGGNDFLINFRGNAIGIRADKNNLPLNYEDTSPASLTGLDIINKWVHVVWVMDPVSSKIYLNGTLIATINEAGTNEGYHDNFSFIGARQVWGSPDNFFKGKLDGIIIYNRVLSDSEITALGAF